jgi:hypothetical protein
MSIRGMEAPAITKTFAFDAPEMQTVTAFVNAYGDVGHEIRVNASTLPAPTIARARELLVEFKDLVGDLGAIKPLSKKQTDKNKATKQRNHLKENLQEIFDLLIFIVKSGFSDLEDLRAERTRDAVLALAARRKGENRKGGIKKFEAAAYHALIDGHNPPETLLGAEVWRARVIKAYGEHLQHALQPPPTLSGDEQAALVNEKASINQQLQAWAGIAVDGPGTNANGTWGTSAGGTGAAFAITTVSQAVWKELRKWWSGKASAFVTASDTSDYSLKMDRAQPDPGLSPRFNYHINVA